MARFQWSQVYQKSRRLPRTSESQACGLYLWLEESSNQFVNWPPHCDLVIIGKSVGINSSPMMIVASVKGPIFPLRSRIATRQ